MYSGTIRNYWKASLKEDIYLEISERNSLEHLTHFQRRKMFLHLSTPAFNQYKLCAYFVHNKMIDETDPGYYFCPTPGGTKLPLSLFPHRPNSLAGERGTN